MEERRASTPERPVRLGRPLSKARGVTGARRAPTSPVRVRTLAGLLEGKIVAGRSDPIIWQKRFDSATDCNRTTATTVCCGPERFRLSVAGSNPVRSTRAPVAQLGRAPGPCYFHDRSRCPSKPRAEEDRLSHPDTGGREPPPGESRVSTSGLHLPRPRLLPAGLRAGAKTVIRESARARAREVAGSIPRSRSAMPAAVAQSSVLRPHDRSLSVALTILRAEAGRLSEAGGRGFESRAVRSSDGR